MRTNERCFKKNFSSAIENVKFIIEENMEFIKNAVEGISTNDYYDLKLVFSELIINAVVHGNKNDKTKFVVLHTKILPDNIVEAIIIDEGNGYNYNDILYRQNDGFFSLDENGRGICIAASLTDDMEFNDKGNEVKFLKKVSING